MQSTDSDATSSSASSPLECDARVHPGETPQVVRILLGHRGHVVDDQDGVHDGSSMVNVVPRPGCALDADRPVQVSR